MARLTLIEVVWVVSALIVILVTVLAVRAPKRRKTIERINRLSCRGNLKNIGMSFFMYTGDYGGYFPNTRAPGGGDFEPLNERDILMDGTIYGCPSYRRASGLERIAKASESDFIYMGSGLNEGLPLPFAVTLAYDRSGNHPDNQWMNMLFIDGHAEGALPDGKKGWNRN